MARKKTPSNDLDPRCKQMFFRYLDKCERKTLDTQKKAAVFTGKRMALMLMSAAELQEFLEGPAEPALEKGTAAMLTAAGTRNGKDDTRGT